MDLPVAELGCLLDQLVDVGIAQHVARDRERSSTGLVDLLGHLLCLGCVSSSARCTMPCSALERTPIDIRHDDIRPLVREEPDSLRTNALARARNDDRLAREHALGVVEVTRDLGCSCVRHGGCSGRICVDGRDGLGQRTINLQCRTMKTARAHLTAKLLPASCGNALVYRGSRGELPKRETSASTFPLWEANSCGAGDRPHFVLFDSSRHHRVNIPHGSQRAKWLL